MELKKIEGNDKKLLIEFPDETSAFVNMIKEKLWDDSSVKEAATITGHPYLSKPRLHLETSRGSPHTAIEKVGEKLLADASELKEKVKAALKK